MNIYIIRIAAINDAEAIMKLRKKVDQEPTNKNPALDPYGGDYPTVNQQTFEIEDRVHNAIFLVAVQNEQIIGAAFCFEVYKQPHKYRLNFIVDPEWRGKGIASAMVLEVVEWAKSHSEVQELICGFEISHKDAKHVLEKYGFIVSKEGYSYYMQGYRYFETEMTLSAESKS